MSNFDAVASVGCSASRLYKSLETQTHWKISLVHSLVSKKFKSFQYWHGKGDSTCNFQSRVNSFVNFKHLASPHQLKTPPNKKKCRHAGEHGYELSKRHRHLPEVNGRMRTYDQIAYPYFGLGPTPSTLKSNSPQRSMGPTTTTTTKTPKTPKTPKQEQGGKK